MKRQLSVCGYMLVICLLSIPAALYGMEVGLGFTVDVVDCQITGNLLSMHIANGFCGLGLVFYVAFIVSVSKFCPRNYYFYHSLIYILLFAYTALLTLVNVAAVILLLSDSGLECKSDNRLFWNYTAIMFIGGLFFPLALFTTCIQRLK